uniref:EF-hand domain-containing protein n=1 Tax=Chlamydomonas leiostraca TaxID=1034604 RepID=A0A7S0S6H3_9CHLO|mmetsp:Transcript_7546/g.18713  ORF Transcript_7546/g.18713 Transcript_7546/m.18713 type:complete len:636 (+) Transcript_7546:112-2019(+)|eukprot:CAMPEP_0202869046 /NCGR_PEP_ID=MMETSP1391-20130828/11726_1 /ASSEMBLY_ACC=CAM_ASM_000867 /TAXON_ID=1034604 /ORGANISM="Chlamydomonas leiostraca, Strain SAG 11-49" /LENGTH=635 /DNA_ID=CAMNT_0049549295 /DNA_START=91 /DNA_END=1998 /DNA_ORIENTATION=+
MAANPPIPKLPGYTVSLPQSLGDKRLGKGQTLTYINGYAREEPLREVKDLPPRDGTGSPAATMSAGAGTGTYSPSRNTGFDSPNKLPQWVENDRKVLRFYGYFKESVVESNIENHRIRKVILYYYLEDDSMHVAEPRQDNSGIPQGVFIKRHKLTKDDGVSFFSPVDFNVGQEVTIYGRTFFLVDADTFTREFYKDNLGLDMSGPLPYPDDPVDAYRATFGLTRGPKGVGTTTQRMDDFKSYIEARLGKPSHLLDGDRLRQFLENNKRVLRFWCIWDDRQSMYGDRRPYVLHYFLEDDTVEILEINENNSGRDPFPVFMRRSPLPKTAQRTGYTTGPKYKKNECYAPVDFRMGSYINVLGRDFLLHDADTFTKDWYKENLGFNDDDLAAVDVKEPSSSLPRPALPPYNGYGTLEDSLQNCLALVPKPPRRDMHKLMNKDKIILRFTVRIVETDTHKHSPTDLARRFVLSYFMMDDSVQVFEPPVRNNGIAGGKFLERQKVYKPSSEEIYTYMDLYVGATLEIFNRTFELMEADEYTYTYMENNKHIFIMADHEILLKSLRAQAAGKEEAIRTAFIEHDKNGSGVLSGEELEAALAAAGLKFTRHQAISLKRRLDKDKSGGVNIEEFLSALSISAH